MAWTEVNLLNGQGDWRNQIVPRDEGFFIGQIKEIHPIPEPATVIFLGIGLAAVWILGRSKWLECGTAPHASTRIGLCPMSGASGAILGKAGKHGSGFPG